MWTAPFGKLFFGVVLAAPDKRLHISGWGQLHSVPKFADLTRPVMRRATGFKSHITRYKCRKEPQDFFAPKLAGYSQS